MHVQVDPAMQALLDSLPTRTVPFAFVDVAIPNTQPPQVQNMAVCAEHKQPVCDVCDVNFTPLNYMQQFMKNAPPEAVPPPPNVAPPPGRADQIKGVKEAGNVSARAQRNSPPGSLRKERLLEEPLGKERIRTRAHIRLPSRPATFLPQSTTTPSRRTWRSRAPRGRWPPSRATRQPLRCVTAQRRSRRRALGSTRWWTPRR